MADEPQEVAAAAGTQSGGTVEIGDSVVAKIAYETCREIEGIHALGGATSRALSGLRGGEHRTSGVAVDLRGEVVDIDLTLVVDYGRSIPQIAQECRDKVRSRVEEITGLQVKAINVVIGDICVPEAEAVEPGGQG